jgi:Uma2 family endonuclease
MARLGRRTMVEARPTTKLTYEDYQKTPDDERWELLDGELVMAPSPTTTHQEIAGNLFLLLTVFVGQMALGRVFIAPLDVVLSDTSVVQPDVLFISSQREHIIMEDNIQEAPDLVVEVLSPSTASRDWRTKLDLYAQHGVREYWVVDPDGQRVWVMAGTDGTLTELANYGRGDTLTSPTLTGFTANLDQVFPARVAS